MAKTVALKLEELSKILAADKLLEEKERMLGTWETGFLTSVIEQVEVRSIHSLSEKQLTKIHDIYDRI